MEKKPVKKELFSTINLETLTIEDDELIAVENGVKYKLLMTPEKVWNYYLK